MASEDGVVTLRTGFEMAVGDYDEAMAKIKAANLSHACFARTELARKIEDSEYPIIGSTATSLTEKGVLDENGILDPHVREIILASLPEKGSDLEASVSGESCPTFFLNEQHLLLGS